MVVNGATIIFRTAEWTFGTDDGGQCRSDPSMPVFSHERPS
jgi:hypothetical protein